MDDRESISRRAVLGGGAAIGAAMAQPARAITGSGGMAALAKVVAAQHDEAIERLRAWIALPTIAAESRNVEEGCAYMMKLAADAGFTGIERVRTDGIPGVFGVMDNGAKHTLALYFMYDVKQYDPAEWTSPPLEGRIVDKAGLGKVMVGRGTDNQKGPQSIVLAALHAFQAMKRKPPVNLILICEGEEEIGSPHFSQIVQTPKILAALRKSVGVCLPTTWQNPIDGSIQVDLGSKGMMEVELTSSGVLWGRGPQKDLHSSYKAIVDSPAWHLVEALQTLVTPDGNRPAIDGWFEKVRPMTAREKALIAESAARRSEANLKSEIGVKHWAGDLAWQPALEQLASLPTVNIEGMISGYTGPGGKTILPGKAIAKLDFRLVPNQTPEDCTAKLKAHLAKRGFGDIDVKVTGAYGPTSTDENALLVKAELATYARAGVTTTVIPRTPGSWPGSNLTDPPVSLPAVKFGLGHGSGDHAPDEYILIDSTNPKVKGFDEATMTYIDFFYQIAAM